MARFQKVIVSPGVWEVATDDGGTRQEVITPARIQKWARNYAKLRSKGYLAPAPFAHVDPVTKQMPHPIKMGHNGTLPRSDLNRGFWDSLSVNSDGALIGEVDIEGDITDYNTPAGKVGTTIKETSVYVKHGFKDGTGEIYDEMPMHIAVVTHPIEGGQSNFQPMASKEGFAIAMSQCVMMATGGGSGPGGFGSSGTDPVSSSPGTSQPGDGNKPDKSKSQFTDPTGDTKGPIATKIVQALRHENIGIDLPDDTDDLNILERLLVACRQKATEKSNEFQLQNQNQNDPNTNKPKPKGSSTRNSPEGATEQPASIAMSQTAITTTPMTLEQSALLMSQVTGLTEANKLLAGYVTKLEKDKRGARIQNLVATGRCTKEYAEAKLIPMLAGFQMSLGADGAPAMSAIDAVLEALEGVPARTTSILGNQPLPSALAGLPPESQAAMQQILMSMGAIPNGANIEHHPNGDAFYTTTGSEMDGDAAQKIANQFLKNTGHNVRHPVG